MSVAYDEFRGLILGYENGASTEYPLTSADGTHTQEFEGGFIDGGGRHGATAAPLLAGTKPWTVLVDVVGANEAAFITQRDTLKEATWNPGSTEYAYDIYRGTEDPLTRFARCIRRQIPEDRDSVVNRYGVASLTFESSDPYTYTEVQTSAALDRGDTLVIDSAGWAASERWTWTVTGPVTNPRLSSSHASSMVVRYNGVVSTGEELVVTVTPTSYSAKLEGVEVNYFDLDGGAGSGRPPQWIEVVPGSQTITFTGTAGAGTATFSWREAKP